MAGREHRALDIRSSPGVSRLGADLIVQARRTAGFTRHELAEHLGWKERAIAEWEGADGTPSVEALDAIVRACGLDLSIRLTTRDDSYDRLIARQLAMTPAARLSDRARAGYAPATTIVALVGSGVQLVVIGSAAAALHGSPLALGDRELEIVPTPESAEALAAALGSLGAVPEAPQATYGPLHPRQPHRLPDGQRVTAIDHPAGTRGYDDLHSDAVLVDIDEQGTRVPIASVVDLLRIADRSPWERDQIGVPPVSWTSNG